MSSSDKTLKTRTAGALGWNLVDKIAAQLLYALTGVILARELMPADFGLAGAIMVFQAFANMFVDSGFSSALIQRKTPTRLDYSSVMWFNILIACVLYCILFLCAPLIADIFSGDERIVPMSRVMFVVIILNSASIVQSNRLTKQMNVRPLTIANTLALASGGAVGIWLAVTGAGAWAIVWQTVVTNGVRCALVWIAARWMPLFAMSWRVLRSFMSVGWGVLATSFLNTLFYNIYNIVVGNVAGLRPLGYYTQGDRWSKMGVMSLSQVITSTFLPTLSEVQDDVDRFRSISARMCRLTAYLACPAMIFLILTAPAIFHMLFGPKWDAAIILFQLLCLRGIFTIITLQYNNIALSLGRSRMIVWMEVLRDGVALVALVATLGYIPLSRPGDIVYGLRIMIYGQILAAVITWFATLLIICRMTDRKVSGMLGDIAPYLVGSLIASAVAIAAGQPFVNPWSVFAVQAVVGFGVYIIINYIAGSVIQREAFRFIFRRHRVL